MGTHNAVFVLYALPRGLSFHNFFCGSVVSFPLFLLFSAGQMALKLGNKSCLHIVREQDVGTLWWVTSRSPINTISPAKPNSSDISFSFYSLRSPGLSCSTVVPCAIGSCSTLFACLWPVWKTTPHLRGTCPIEVSSTFSFSFLYPWLHHEVLVPRERLFFE